MSYLTIFTYYFGITLYFLEIILYVVISSISSIIIYNVKEGYKKIQSYTACALLTKTKAFIQMKYVKTVSFPHKV